MNNKETKQIAAQYLISRRIDFVPDGDVTNISSSLSEVRFLIPEALDPNLVVDPQDVRVIVHHESRTCELVLQM
jgi:hypothetical protein|uniref:hypothetical protein n=1 Tax=Prosthecobacter sp. TaxID=1965333 RepID=UPI003784C8B3